jgi:predicted ATP-grasp superfamily ATP-dependent carboligase
MPVRSDRLMPSQHPALSNTAPRVIVLHGRSLVSLVVAHSLSRHGVEVIGADDVKLTVLSFSRFVRRTFVHAPIDEDPDAFVDDLVEQIRLFRPHDDRPYVLMPVLRETRLIAQHRHRLEPYVTVAAPPYDAISQLDPKDRLAATARRLGVRIPLTFVPSSQDELETRIAQLPFPVLLKPRDEMGGRGIELCTDAPELLDAYRRFVSQRHERPLVQQWVDGDEYCLTLLVDHGKIRASMAYRNLRKYPPEAGAGVIRETVDDTPFLTAVSDLFGQVGWHGVAQIDFLWNGTDPVPYLIEVNPRFWLGLFHSVESGIDFPWLLYRLTVEGTVEASAPAKIGRRTKIPGLWLIGAIRDIAASDESFHMLEDEWRRAGDDSREGRLRETIRTMVRRGDGQPRVRDLLPRLRAIVDEGRSAKNDVFFRDDPFVPLGVMYVIASLIRHGRLPPDLRR